MMISSFIAFSLFLSLSSPYNTNRRKKKKKKKGAIR